MPAVIIRDESYGAIANLSLTSELRFLEVCHTDDVHAPAAIDTRFRFGRELRSFHTDIRSAAFDRNIGVAPSLLDDITKLRTDRIAEADVHDDSFTKERGEAVFRPIVELIGQNDIERPQFLFERADSAC